MRSNSWLYHYYMVQSRLQYGLAYGSHHPSLYLPTYPQMLGGGQSHTYPPYNSHHHSLHSAYLHTPHLPVAPVAAPYPSYGYTPPAGSYHITENSSHQVHVTETRDTTPAPLDFSKSPDVWQEQSVKHEFKTKDSGDSLSWENYLRPQDLSSSKQSSPSWRSDSSGSPLHLPPLDPGYGSLTGETVALMTRTHPSHLGDRIKPDWPITQTTTTPSYPDWKHQLNYWSDNININNIAKIDKDANKEVGNDRNNNTAEEIHDNRRKHVKAFGHFQSAPKPDER